MFRRHAHTVFLIFNAGRGNSKGVEVIVAKNVFNVFYCEPKNGKNGVFYSQLYKKREVFIQNKEFL